MDSRIQNLKTTTFQGKRLTRKQIAEMQHTVNLFPGLSRRELALTICEHFQWYTAQGEARVKLSLRVLEQLEQLGVFELPAKATTTNPCRSRAPIVWSSRSQAQAPICADLQELMPLQLQVVNEKADIGEWNEFVDRYHYLDYKQPIGTHLRYSIVDRQGRKLGALLFSFAVTRLRCRDEWIGWQDQAHKKSLHLVVNNNRYVLFPWVKVKNLASKVLSMACQQLADDWQQHHGYRPVLVETFVDEERFDASCYRAANWHYLGTTQKRWGKTLKGVYVYELEASAKDILVHGASAKRKKQPSKIELKPLTADDPFVQLWQNIIGMVSEVAMEYDQQWQQRKRVLNSLLIMLFIFRLVFFDNRQGYATTINELWHQCRVLGIALPQNKPVAASAMCNARRKLDENIFKVLQRRILKYRGCQESLDLWQGHRLFAVDGSKLNLPRGLLNDGYTIPNSRAYYPQGMLSCLYQLRSKLPVDFELVSHANERQMVHAHLGVLQAQDVVVYDRGYYSFELLYLNQRQGVDVIFRTASNANTQIVQFNAREQTDQIIDVPAPSRGVTHLRKKYGDAIGQPITLRLVKYTVKDTTYTLATTLLDQQRYSVAQLSDLYHGRWSIEELYKTSKNSLTMEQFHAKYERGVKQELYAHFVLITLSRLFCNHSEQDWNEPQTDRNSPRMLANFKHSLTVFARHIENLLLQHTQLLTTTLFQIKKDLSKSRAKERPNRSFVRQSKKPVSKWKPSKPAKTKS